MKMVKFGTYKAWTRHLRIKLWIADIISHPIRLLQKTRKTKYTRINIRKYLKGQLMA